MSVSVLISIFISSTPYVESIMVYCGNLWEMGVVAVLLNDIQFLYDFTLSFYALAVN